MQNLLFFVYVSLLPNKMLFKPKFAPYANILNSQLVDQIQISVCIYANFAYMQICPCERKSKFAYMSICSFVPFNVEMMLFQDCF